MKSNFTFLLKSSLMVLFLCLGFSVWGQSDNLSCPLGEISEEDEMFFSTTNFSIIHAKGGSSNFAEFSPWRVYTDNTVVFIGNSNVQKITNIVITATSNGYANVVSNGDFEVLEGTGTITKVVNNSVVTLNFTGNISSFRFIPSAQTRWSNILINYELAPMMPSISTNLTTLNMATTVGTSITADIEVIGTLLTSDIDVSVEGTGFSISTMSLSEIGGTLTVTYNPMTLGNDIGLITLSSQGADNIQVNLNGVSSLAIPVATAATEISSDGFTANWNTVMGAETYEISVYTLIGTLIPDTTVVGWDFEDQNAIADSGLEANTNNTISTNATGLTYSSISGSNGNVATTTGGWSSGSGNKYWKVSLTTVDVSDLKLSSVQRSSNTGPKDFKVQYSLNDSNWFDITGAIVTVANNFTTGAITNISLPSACNNQPIIYLRWIMTSNNAVNNSSVAGTGTSAIDSIIISGVQGSITNQFVEGSPFIVNAPNNFLNLADLESDTDYYYVVSALGENQVSETSNEISVQTLAIPATIVWTTDNEWSNVTGPTIDNDVVVEGDLFVGIDLPGFEAKTLTVDTNGSLYIESGNSVTVAGQIINEAGVSNFIVESGANLRQTSDYTGANEGQITVYRDSQPMKRLDYTLWSSPVEGMLLKDFSNVSLTGGNGTIWNRVYTLGATEWEQVWGTQAIFQTDNTTTFTEAKGYLYRSRNDFSSENPTVFEGEFFGVPNNGTKTLITPNTYDAVGNPYPSTINADLFFEENDEATAVYFWTNTNPAVGGTYEGQGTNWASYTLAGGVGTDSADNSSVVPNGLIAAGQGFVVENLGSSVMFNNEMRVGNSGMFFKTMETEKHRLWLNLSVENITLNQMMIAYMDGATQGFDSQIDGKMYGYEGSALYSTITTQQDAYIIQGRSLPFSDTDVVHLGFKATQAGTYTVSLVDFDGLFVEGQEVYLKDNSTGIEYDLKNGDYSFVSQEGIFENRFEVVYKTNADLSVTNPNLDNKWVIYSQGNEFQIETQGFDMKNVTLYDVLGRTVYNNQAEGTNHVMSNIANGVFIVKVITSDNQTLIKKIAK